jgi:hypothetical protein
MKPKTIEMSLNLDKTNLDRVKNFFGTYDFETIIGDMETKHYLGEKEPRICRF